MEFLRFPFSGVDVGSLSPEDSILFLFSDTMVGEIDNGRLKPGYIMINNSCMILHGEEPRNDRVRFLVNSNKDVKPAALFVPNAATTQAGDYYWLGDGFVNSAHAAFVFLPIESETQMTIQFSISGK